MTASDTRRWWVYLIECVDGSVYTGIAVDVAARYARHASGKGARYTRTRPPQRLLGAFPHPDRSAALKAEHAIRRLTAAAKRALCASASAADASGGTRLHRRPASPGRRRTRRV